MGNLLQVLVDTSLTVTEAFTVDGAAIDVDSGLPTLVATYPSGAALSPVPTVSSSWTGRTTGQYRWVLDPEPEVTYLDYELTGTIGGKTQKLKGRVEWLGAQLFTIGELRDYAMPGSLTKPFTDPAKYPDKQLHKARAAVLSRFTKALEFSPVPRYEREVHSVGYRDQVILKKLYPRKLLTVTVTGAVQVASGYLIGEGGVVLPVSAYQAGPWTSYGIGNVAIEYEHGAEGVDEDGSDAALQLAAARLNPSTFTSGTSYTTPDGVSVTYEPSEVGRGGFQRFTGIREVDRWLNLNAQVNAPVA